MTDITIIMTDIKIKEPINTTSDGTFLSVVCANTKKKCYWPNVGGLWPPQPPPRNYPPEYLLQEVFELALVWRSRPFTKSCAGERVWNHGNTSSCHSGISLLQTTEY